MATEEKLNFATRIKTARIHAALSQAEAAREVGIARAIISRWETGKTESAPTDILFTVARVYRVSAEWLITGNSQMVIQQQDSREKEALIAMKRKRNLEEVTALLNELSNESVTAVHEVSRSLAEFNH